MTPDEIIEKGIENIQQYGHVKGTLGDTDRGFCAIGSMRQAAFGSNVVTEDEDGHENRAAYFGACKRLANTIVGDGPILAEWVMSSVIPEFNDDHGTTAEDVTLMMKRSLDT